MLNINDMPGYIPLGNQRDFGHTVQFDLTAWDDLNADDWKITYTRPGESATYPVPDGDVSVADNVLTWTISEAVTAISGAGSLVIEAYRGGEMLKHSALIMTIIGEGHEPAGEAPDPVSDWIAGATSKLAEVDHFIGEAVDATESANAAAGLTNDAIDRANAISETMEDIEPKWADVDISVSALNEGTAPTASITQDETGTSIALGIPKGDTGDTGNGIASVTLTAGNHAPGTTDTYTITYTDDTTTTFTVYNGTDGVTTASQLPIVDAGGYFATDNVEAALQEVGAQFVASELPVATYTYNGNAEIVVSAVDVDTDTFTSVGHGLLDTDRIFPTLNLSAMTKYPLQVYAGGMEQTRYYVVNKTDDTFQISLTSGGAAVNLTANATIDLASWHFEKGVVDGIIISDLTAKKKYRAIAQGKYSSPGVKYFAPFKPTSWSDTTGFAGSSINAYSYPRSSGAGYGGIQMIAKMEFDTTLGWLSMEYQCVDVNTGNAAQITPTYSMDIYSIPYTLKNTEITAIRFKQHNQFVANGTTMEVYDA